MRFIDNRQLRLPEGWQEEAQEALKRVRSNECCVNDCGGIWRKLKDALADLSNDKCWYCESLQERSDDAVDHYRPKNRVSDSDRPHEGYWWLAFDHKNYRYSCTFCNSKRKNPESNQTQGKGDAFPLIDENKRGYRPGEERHENPALINPCKSMEPGWLDFRVDGTPCAKYPNQALKKTKAEKSIFYYHLDHPDVIEARRNIGVDLESWVNEANEIFNQICQGNSSLDNVFDGIVRNIIKAMNEKASYSAFARRVVDGYRNFEWVEELFQTV